jgi:4-amino-4-deoxy-L-arabinose transferase-like glycosyltransferase
MDQQHVTQLVGLAGVPAVMAIVELIKPFCPGASKTWPVLALIIALTINLSVAILRSTDLLDAAAAGMLAGLAASGLWSSAKQWTQPETQRENRGAAA